MAIDDSIAGPGEGITGPGPGSGGGGGGTPGGSNGQVQFNNSGNFGGLTNAQLTAYINAFSDTLSGAVPASGGGTTNFLRADGSFAAPSATIVVGGSDTQVQFNSSGTLGGAAQLTYSNGTVAVAGNTSTAAGTTGVLIVGTLPAGSMIPDRTGLIVSNSVGESTSGSFFCITDDRTGITHDNTTTDVFSKNFNADGFGGGFGVDYARGTSASPTRPQSGDQIGGWSWRAFDSGVTFRIAARLNAYVDGSISSGVVPGRIEFQVGNPTTNGVNSVIIIGSNRTTTFSAGADNALVIAKADTTYNMLSFNGTVSSTNGMCIEGGSNSDPTIYYNVPSGGGHSFDIAGTPRLTVDVAGIYSGSFTPLGQSGHPWAGVYLRGNSYGTLTAGLTPAVGLVVCVTDSTTNSWGGTVAGGGANTVIAWYNGAIYKVMGA